MKHPRLFRSSIIDNRYNLVSLLTLFSHSRDMEQRLSDAAKAGNIDTLYDLITQDPFLLDKIDRFPFHQTPLHDSALAGQTCFALELANLKPSLLKKVNQDGYSPIHLASTAGHLETVRGLLDIETDLALLKGREWRVPLHCAALNGRVEVLHELLSVHPDGLKCLTVQKETAVHLALKHDQIEAFAVLLERLKASQAEEVVNWKDREGNTVLHLAIYKKQLQIVELLLNVDPICKEVEVNTRNGSGLTALEILLQEAVNEPSYMEIILRNSGAVTGRDAVVSVSPSHPPNSSTCTNSHVEPLVIMEKLLQGFPMEAWAREIETSPQETRSVLMVVAVLITTVTFQVVLSPPGGYASNGWHRKYPNTLTTMGYNNPIFFVVMLSINSIGFVASLAMITVLTQRFPLKALLRMAVLSMAASYFCTIAFTSMRTPIPVAIIGIIALTILLVQGLYLQIRSLWKLKFI